MAEMSENSPSLKPTCRDFDTYDIFEILRSAGIPIEWIFHNETLVYFIDGDEKQAQVHLDELLQTLIICLPLPDLMFLNAFQKHLGAYDFDSGEDDFPYKYQWEV